ncbi:MAG: hypothetical protein HQ521_06155 [Bacteroidetes bacterium]|nr:hypothetical protein [Bacteroidota bacterium]
MKNILLGCILIIMISSCQNNSPKRFAGKSRVESDSLAQDVVNETYRSWMAYKKYA